MPKTTESGTLWDFLTSILSPSITKIKGGTFEEKNSKKVSQCQKKILVSPGTVCYAEKQENPFRFLTVSETSVLFAVPWYAHGQTGDGETSQ